MSQAGNPTGFKGRMMAKSMAKGHKDFYVQTAKALSLKPEDKLLELGFGAGAFIQRHASHVSKIAGLDISGDMVDLAISTNADLVDSGKADFKQGDASAIPWGDGEFTAVCNIEVFYFFPDPKQALKEIYRVLTPGGRVVIEMGLNKDDGLDHSKEAKKHGMTLYNSEEIHHLLTETGFNNITIEYFQAFKVPIKGYMVPKGMLARACK